MRDLFFSTEGRTRRRTFVLTFFPVMTLGVILSEAVLAFFWPIIFVMLLAGGVAFAKRFQDRGWPGRKLGSSWALGSLAVLVLTASSPEFGTEATPGEWLIFAWGNYTLCLMFVAVFFKGTEGDNKYGPDPRVGTGGPVTPEDKEFWDKPPI